MYCLFVFYFENMLITVWSHIKWRAFTIAWCLCLNNAYVLSLLSLSLLSLSLSLSILSLSLSLSTHTSLLGYILRPAVCSFPSSIINVNAVVLCTVSLCCCIVNAIYEAFFHCTCMFVLRVLCVCVCVCVFRQIDKGQIPSYLLAFSVHTSFYLFLTQSWKPGKGCIGLETQTGLAEVQH